MLNEILVARSFSFVESLFSFSGSFCYISCDSIILEIINTFLCTSQLGECYEANRRRPFYKQANSRRPFYRANMRRPFYQQAKSPSQFPTMPGECCKANSCGRFYEQLNFPFLYPSTTGECRNSLECEWDDWSAQVWIWKSTFACWEIWQSNHHQAYLEG